MVKVALTRAVRGHVTHSKDAPDTIQAEEPPDSEPHSPLPASAPLPHRLAPLEPLHVVRHLALHLFHRADLELESLELRRSGGCARPTREEGLARSRLCLACGRALREGKRAMSLSEVEAGTGKSALRLRDLGVGDWLTAGVNGVRMRGRAGAGERKGTPRRHRPPLIRLPGRVDRTST